MAEEESLELEENVEPKSKKKLIIFAAIGALLVVLLGVGAWLFLSGGEPSDETMAEGEQTEQSEPANSREAFYVGMPRPFLFNLPGQNRSDRKSVV